MQTKNERLPSLFLLIYMVLLLISYSMYVIWENTRLSHAQQWLSETNITQNGVDSISQLGRWTTLSESMFLVIFVIAMIVVMLRYQKKPTNQFFIGNAALFVGIAVVSYVISLMSSMPIGNLIQPIIVPVFILVALYIYRLWKTRYEK
ncbi:hypothetical protein NKT34_20975 [Paenibacillus polysaccharolyticus]|uniref:DUF4386 domain-containing protein n=1 Tax=Paenibacillus cucumis (ex Kampfer et al. 2016) TaxID=1776858 RepID=A0ABS7KL18_9BACL|nr:MULTISPECIES: hypothetical protein [Paenibacillus]MBY0204661.1 hypothetical protein [Paenibacillus cucumis (ex Kampfer et al. 2016)]MCP1135777.1 hypothetical protein [Paenibacillus polysaccharolyticus]